MANFCVKCGSRLNEQGLCPVCSAPPAPARRFCVRCGQVLNADGLCPVCDAPVAESTPVAEPVGVTAVLTEEPAPAVTEPMAEEIPAQPQISLADAAEPVVAVEETPAEEAPIDQGIEAPADKKSKRKGRGALTVIITILLSICLFITSTLAITVLAVRHTVSKGGVATICEKLDIPALLKSSGVANSNNFKELYNRLEENYGVEMDDEKLAEFIEESTVTDYVTEKATEFSATFFEEEAELTITKREMEDLVYQNRKLIASYADDNIKLDKDDCKRIAGWLFKGNSIGFSTENLAKNSPVIYYSATVGLSYFSFGFFVLLTVLILFVMCRNSLSQAAIGGGVVYLILGGVTSLAIAMVELIPSLWSTIAGNNLVFNLLGTLLSVNAVIFLILFGLGILALVARSVVKAILAKKANV